mmetsp:Transcript_46827/g.112245  ORF Transcript_46827/g.112245 Transcript_46827/m.112245 type:complete len:521 (+) Transcript_46827:241-1803(+)
MQHLQSGGHPRASPSNPNFLSFFCLPILHQCRLLCQLLCSTGSLRSCRGVGAVARAVDGGADARSREDRTEAVHGSLVPGLAGKDLWQQRRARGLLTQAPCDQSAHERVTCTHGVRHRYRLAFGVDGVWPLARRRDRHRHRSLFTLSHDEAFCALRATRDDHQLGSQFQPLGRQFLHFRLLPVEELQVLFRGLRQVHQPQEPLQPLGVLGGRIPDHVGADVGVEGPQRLLPPPDPEERPEGLAARPVLQGHRAEAHVDGLEPPAPHGLDHGARREGAVGRVLLEEGVLLAAPLCAADEGQRGRPVDPHHHVHVDAFFGEVAIQLLSEEVRGESSQEGDGQAQPLRSDAAVEGRAPRHPSVRAAPLGGRRRQEVDEGLAGDAEARGLHVLNLWPLLLGLLGLLLTVLRLCFLLLLLLCLSLGLCLVFCLCLCLPFGLCLGLPCSLLFHRSALSLPVVLDGALLVRSLVERRELLERVGSSIAGVHPPLLRHGSARPWAAPPRAGAPDFARGEGGTGGRNGS